MAGRQTRMLLVMLPTGSAREIAMRISAAAVRHSVRATSLPSAGCSGIDLQAAASAQRPSARLRGRLHRWRRRGRRLAAAIRRSGPARALDDLESRRSSPLRAMRAARSACASMASARSDGSASIHSIATDPARRRPAARRALRHQRRQRHGQLADDLAVMLEHGIRQARCARDDACSRFRHDLDRHCVERIGRTETEGCRRGGAHALARPAQRLQHGEPRWPEAGGHRASQRARPGPSPSRRSSASTQAPGCRCGRRRSSSRPCRRRACAFGERPAEPGGAPN